MTTRSRTFSLALVAAVGLAGLAAAPAQAAKKPKAPSYVAVANGVAGVSSVIRISAPRYGERTVTIAATQPGSPTITMPVILDVAGNGAAAWTPSAAGSWAIQGQGDFAVATGSSVNIAPVPTETSITVAAQGQANAAMDVYATVTSVSGSLAPQGTVSFATVYGTALGTASLTPGTGATSTARISWTPSSVGYYPIVATYNPANGTGGAANTISSSATQTVFVMQSQPLLTIRVPSTLRVGQASTVAGVVNNIQLAGSVAMTTDANGTVTSIFGSTPLQNNVASGSWVPTTSGNQILSASFSSTNSDATATQTQIVNVLGPKPADALSVGPSGQGAWPVGTDITLPAGATVALGIATQSGAPTTSATSGNCLVIDGTLFPTSTTGSCTLVVSSTGTSTYAPADATYTFTIKRVR